MFWFDGTQDPAGHCPTAQKGTLDSGIATPVAAEADHRLAVPKATVDQWVLRFGIAPAMGRPKDRFHRPAADSGKECCRKTVDDFLGVAVDILGRPGGIGVQDSAFISYTSRFA